MFKYFKNLLNNFHSAEKDVMAMEANHYDIMSKQADTKVKKVKYRQYAKEMRSECNKVGKSK